MWACHEEKLKSSQNDTYVRVHAESQGLKVTFRMRMPFSIATS